jgi:hypothetical protein
VRPGKAELHRIRMTVGGDRLDAHQDVRSPAVGIADTKSHINSTISDRWWFHRKHIPQETLDACNLTSEHFDSHGCACLGNSQRTAWSQRSQCPCL